MDRGSGRHNDTPYKWRTTMKSCLIKCPEKIVLFNISAFTEILIYIRGKVKPFGGMLEFENVEEDFVGV
ncbi:MAG: hypothetical protein NVS4B1_00180 [Ktedonobacteraceae bacterium]